MSERSKKRKSTQGRNDKKKARRTPSVELVVPPNLNLPPSLDNANVLPGVNDDVDPQDLDPLMTPEQKADVSEIRALLKKAYENAPIANFNPELQNLIEIPWHEVRYDPGNKSLAYILKMEQGWSAQAMSKIIGEAQAPFRVHPLDDRESRWLWASLRFADKIDKLIFKVDIPANWLTDKMNAKVLSKKVAKVYAQKLAALIAFNQSEFYGKEDYWFRPLCQKLGLTLTANFVTLGYIIIIFVVCVDANIFENATQEIEGNWGDSGNRRKVVVALTKAVKEAESNNAIAFPDTFQLFKNLFPYVLK